MAQGFDRLMSVSMQISERVNFTPEIAIVLGSGLGEFAETINIHQIVNYSDIQGFPIATNKGHKGRFVFGTIGDKKVVIMQGRIHYYEGYSMEEVVLPIRVMKGLGAEKLIITNAAGGIGEHLRKGELMMITDQITSFVPSPLIGNSMFGETSFPDMTNVFCKEYQQVAKNAANKLGINLKEGVYLQTTGPNYETPAEIRMFKRLGADAVGMSTACEAMVANQMGMKICGISCITNKAAGLEDERLDDEDVKATAEKVSGQFKMLLEEIIKSL